jgi:hypothetical protein
MYLSTNSAWLKDTTFKARYGVHVCHLSTPEAEAGGLKVRDQPDYLARPCIQKTKQKKGIVFIT